MKNMTIRDPLEGKKAPAFVALDQDGTRVALKDYKGKPVVLYFYPRISPLAVPRRRAISVTTGPK